ncbi:glycosyltransferase family 4 protein [Halobacteriaceae archaeon GCM10025711]
MDVLGVTDYLGNVGGAEVSANTILSALADHPETGRVGVVGMDFPRNDRLQFDGVEVFPVSGNRAIDSLPELVGDLVISRLLSRQIGELKADFDVIHAHHRRSIMAVNRVETTSPTVGTIRDFWPICPISTYTVGNEACSGCDTNLSACLSHQGWDGFREPVVRRYLLGKRRHNRSTYPGLSGTIFISRHLLDTIASEFDTSPRATVINNPVSIDPDDVNSELFASPTFVTASSLTREKGVGDVIDAFIALSDSYPDAKLRIYGDGPQREELERRSTGNNVYFHGRVSVADVYDAFASATAVVFPSKWEEPFGRVTVEAMTLGTPVVGTRVGGIEEVIDDGNTGILVPPGDADAIKTALRELLDNDSAATKLGERARKAARSYMPARIAEKHLQFYSELTN